MESLNEEIIVPDEEALNLDTSVKIEGLYSEDELDSENPSLSSSTINSYLPFKRTELDEKEYNKFIKNCERLVRSSLEYKDFILFCRETFKADVCSLTGETNDETGDIELHHYPLTLFDLCKIVLDDKLYKEVKFSSFDIALEVIKLHFCMFIGIVPLAGTLHKKYHNGNLEIPIQTVRGNYKKIRELYDLDPEIMSKLTLAENIKTSPYIGHIWGSDVALENSSETKKISNSDNSASDTLTEMQDIFADLK